ncbi:MAG: VWA domain-containing protein, partial [Blastocatellia bacterium]
MIARFCKIVALGGLITQMFLGAHHGVSAQSGAGTQPSSQEKPIKLGTSEVVVDAVVIDKKNRLVSDLAAEEFEVFEDGVKQRVASFRFESTAAGAQQLPKSLTATPVTPVAPRTGNLVSLVFDAQAAREGALMARKAALDYIDSGMGPNDFVGVFGVDLGLMVLSPFTQDKETLKRAVESFTSRDAKRYGLLSQEVRSELEKLSLATGDADKLSIVDTWVEQDLTIAAPGSTSEGRTVEAPSPATFTLMRNQLNITMLRTLRTFARYEREIQGRNIVTALLSVITGQQSLTGRKVMLLFSEGFPVSPAVSDQFRSVISAANVAGMTIYTIDVGGLRLINPDEDAQVEKDAAARSTLRNPNPELVVGGRSALGRMEEAMRLNVVSNLDELSGDTGGYTIKNTNDLGDGLRRISEEVSSHYVLTYSPANQNFDGKYRKVVVKVTRAGEFAVRARRGYYAFRALDNSPVLAHELPLIEQSNQRTLPQDFPVYAKVLQFRGMNGARAVPIYVELPIASVKLNTDEKTKSFSARYTILVLVKDQKQQVVRKLGQEFLLRGPLTQVASVKEQPHLFSRIILLRPGHYSVEAFARDSTTSKISGIRLPLDVAEIAEDKLRASSVVLSRGVNPLSEEQK